MLFLLINVYASSFFVFVFPFTPFYWMCWLIILHSFVWTNIFWKFKLNMCKGHYVLSFAVYFFSNLRISLATNDYIYSFVTLIFFLCAALKEGVREIWGKESQGDFQSFKFCMSFCCYFSLSRLWLTVNGKVLIFSNKCFYLI